MSSFWEEHEFVIIKQELGITFLKCVKHNPPEYAVAIGITINDSDGEINYIGTDKKYAEFLYSNLVSWRKNNCQKNT